MNLREYLHVQVLLLCMYTCCDGVSRQGVTRPAGFAPIALRGDRCVVPQISVRKTLSVVRFVRPGLSLAP